MVDVSPHPQIAVKDRCNVKFKDKVHWTAFFMHLLLFSRYLLEMRAMKNLESIQQLKGGGPVLAISVKRSAGVLRCLLYPGEKYTDAEYTSKIPGLYHLWKGYLYLFLHWVERNVIGENSRVQISNLKWNCAPLAFVLELRNKGYSY